MVNSYTKIITGLKRKIATLIAVAILVSHSYGTGIYPSFAGEVDPESRQYYSIGYRVLSEWSMYSKVSSYITLPKVSGIDDEKPEYMESEAAYNYLGVERLGQSVDFGFYKSKKDKNRWYVFSYYVTYSPGMAKDAFLFTEKRYPKSSSYTNGLFNGKVWSSYSFSVPDDAKVYMELYTSRQDEITLGIRYGDKTTRIPYCFKGANVLGKDMRFRRESNMIAYGSNGGIDASMETRWDAYRGYERNQYYKWHNIGYFYRDDENLEGGLPKNIGVLRDAINRYEIIRYGKKAIRGVE